MFLQQGEGQLQDGAVPAERTGIGDQASGAPSDAWLSGRARELIARLEMAPPEQQRQTIAELDALLAQARHRGEPWLLASMLRTSVVARLVAIGTVLDADPILDEMLAHSRRHGLVVPQADAHALRGWRALRAGSEDTALTEVAQALAILDEQPEPDLLVGHREWNRMLCSALLDVVVVLSRLGMYEDAEPVLARAQGAVKRSGGPHEIAVQLINRSTLLVHWGLRLERVGQQADAAERFTTAAAMARAAERPYAESLFRAGGRDAADQVAVLAAAVALAEPGLEHIDRLTTLLDGEQQGSHLIVLAIALARCLDREGRDDEALTVLVDAHDRLGDDDPEPTLRLSLLREYARLYDREATGQGGALHIYLSELEKELWNRRSAQIAALAARREHERLSREHGAIARQALQDPLTGLPNRRALDERLEALAVDETAQPLSIALVDLDGFKEVNDYRSHAEGDDVLRVIASTMRDTLRGDDLVARYGGDEFVVLLPGAALPSARAALQRAVDAISALPAGLSHGVTLSVGVVTMLAHEAPMTALMRADASMYMAKRRGGDQVAATLAPEDVAAGAAGDGDPVDDVATWVLPEAP